MLLAVKGKIARFAEKGCLGSHGGDLCSDATTQIIKEQQQQHTALEKRLIQGENMTRRTMNRPLFYPASLDIGSGVQPLTTPDPRL